MNAVVMDDAHIGDESIVAAMALVPMRQKIPPRSLVAGIPAKVIRPVTDKMIADKRRGTELYQELARRCRAELRPVEPLAAVEDGRPRYDWGRFRY